MQPQTSRRWPTAAVAVVAVLSLLLVVLGVAGIVGLFSLGRMREANQELEAQLAQAEARISTLESQLAEAQAGDNPLAGEPGDLFGELLGELFSGEEGDLGGLEDFLGELFGGDNGGLESLFRDAGQCLVPSSADISIGDVDLATQVDEIAAAVEEIRGLEFPTSIDPLFVSADEMVTRVRELAIEAYPADVADLETRLWVSLGMLEPGYDLIEEQLDLLDDAVAGYYDPDTGELVVSSLSTTEPLGPIDQVTLAHEMIHALTDQTLNFPDAIDDPRTDPDRARAIQALIEGDATLGMQQFSLGSLDLSDQLGMMLDPRLAASQADLGDYPYILANGLQLPYLEGMAFACALYGVGGWDLVDLAYDNPPGHTAQILFPERYLDGWTPADPPAGGDPGPDWTLVEVVGSAGSFGFGAFDLLQLFGAPGDDPGAALTDGRERAQAWGGGVARVYSRGADTAVLLSLIDSGESLHPLCESMQEWDASAFGVEHVQSIVACDGAGVMVAISPDDTTSRRLLG